MRSIRMRPLALGVAALLLAPIAWPQQQPAAPRPRGIPARLKVGRKRLKVVLLGRQEGNVLYAYPGSVTGAAALRKQDILDVDLELPVDRAALSAAERSGNWSRAGVILARAAAPALIYVDLPGSEAAPAALRAARYLMRGGDAKSRCGLDPDALPAALPEYRMAMTLLDAARSADWFDDAEEALPRAVICRRHAGDLDAARELLESVGEPDVTDDTYGAYALSRAYLLHSSEAYVDALEAAVRSIDFQTKDLDTFPVALLLSAACYEQLEEWHRARDVYYEVAVLFERTHWGQQAVQRLKLLVDEERTAEKEQAGVGNVFFGTAEDVDAKVAELLTRYAEPQNGAGEDANEDEE